MKSIVKEIFIILLLCIALCLVFGVIFYDYIPNNKVVPSTVEAYKTSNTIKDEISQEIVDYPKQNITLEITDSDLTIKKQDKSYESGKANPFSNTISLHRVILQKIQLHRLETITRTRIRTQQTTILIILVENN